MKSIHDVPDCIYCIVKHKSLYGKSDNEVDVYIISILPELLSIENCSKHDICRSLELLLGWNGKDVVALVSKYNKHKVK